MANEVARRLVHASGATIPGAYVLSKHVSWLDLQWTHIQWVLIAGTVVTIVLEALRLFAGLEWVVYDKLTREYEQDNVAGYALYVFGGTLVGLVFEPRIAIPAMLMLTLGDPVSGLLGSGELRTIKRWPVLAAMFTTCFLLAYPFLPLHAAALAAVAATLADGVKPVIATYVIDDNITIPIAAAVTAFVVL
ncbi:dolichol kinase [Halostella pelagica]|uniref:dolichol kinase n=1 Tax=Halostella pelagica TaxID=2583824 RepID=UPI001081A9D5|nr:dolichol kinase [Halostella pelagica]